MCPRPMKAAPMSAPIVSTSASRLTGASWSQPLQGRRGMAAFQDRRGRYSDAYAQAPPLFGPRKDLAGVASGLLKEMEGNRDVIEKLSRLEQQSKGIKDVVLELQEQIRRQNTTIEAVECACRK